MTLVLQWFHDHRRLDLGKRGRSVLVFQCPGGSCPTWDAESGANRAFVLEPSVGPDGLSGPEECGADPEFRILRWTEHEDGIPEEMEPAFFDDTSELPESLSERAAPGTRVGSVPRWHGGAEDGPGAGWRFLGQVDATMRFQGPIPSAEAAGCPVGRPGPEGYEFRSPRTTRPGAPAAIFVEKEDGAASLWTAEGPAFGDGGTGYLFASVPDRPDAPAAPRVRFLWQSPLAGR